MTSDTEFVVVCEGCGTFEEDEDTGMVILKDMKENECSHLGSAELLRDIHDIKSNHRPYIRTVVRDEDGITEDEHVPEWAEGGYRSPANLDMGFR